MWEDLCPIVEEGMLINSGKQLRHRLILSCNINLTLHRCRCWVSEYKDLVALAPLVPDLILDIGDGGLQWVTGKVCFILYLRVEDL